LEFCVRWKLETGILTIEDVIYDFIHSWVWVHLRGRPGRVSSRRMFWHGSCISLCPEPGALRFEEKSSMLAKGWQNCGEDCDTSFTNLLHYLLQPCNVYAYMYSHAALSDTALPYSCVESRSGYRESCYAPFSSSTED
jgi:hypothetical protein